jgi:hypothetical protein
VAADLEARLVARSGVLRDDEHLVDDVADSDETETYARLMSWAVFVRVDRQCGMG